MVEIVERGLGEREPGKRLRRLCHVVGYPVTPGPSGDFLMPRFYLRLTKVMIDTFPAVTLVGHASPDKSSGDLELCPPNAAVTALPFPKNRLWRWCRQFPVLWRAVADADLVCVNIPNEAGFLTALVCRMRKRRLMVQVIGDWGEAARTNGKRGPASFFKSRIADWMARLTVRNAELVFTQGESLFQKYSIWFPESVKSAVVHSTLLDEVFCKKERLGLHIPARILSVSALLPLKGLDYLARALQILLQGGHNVEWFCAGAGPARRELEQLAKMLGASEKIHFVGHVPFGPDLFRMYRQSDIFVLPSLTEGVPNALLEAMANSIPVVATGVGGIPPVVRDGVDGYLVPPANPQALAGAISKLIAEPQAALRMGANAHQRATGFHSQILRAKNRLLIESVFGEIEKLRAGEFVTHR